MNLNLCGYFVDTQPIGIAYNRRYKTKFSCNCNRYINWCLRLCRSVNILNIYFRNRLKFKYPNKHLLHHTRNDTAAVLTIISFNETMMPWIFNSFRSCNAASLLTDIDAYTWGIERWNNATYQLTSENIC
jgi:hypothetical protein